MKVVAIFSMRFGVGGGRRKPQVVFCVIEMGG